MTRIAKVIEIIGNSDKSWQDAAQVALDEAKKIIHGIANSPKPVCSLNVF